MKEFWSSVIAIAVIAVLASVVLNSVDMSAQSVYSTDSVRR